MRLLRLVARLAMRRGTMTGMAVVAAVVLPLGLRGWSRGSPTLPDRSDAPQTGGPPAAAASTAEPVGSAPAGA